MISPKTWTCVALASLGGASIIKWIGQTTSISHPLVQRTLTTLESLDEIKAELGAGPYEVSSRCRRVSGFLAGPKAHLNFVIASPSGVNAEIELLANPASPGADTDWDVAYLSVDVSRSGNRHIVDDRNMLVQSRPISSISSIETEEDGTDTAKAGDSSWLRTLANVGAITTGGVALWAASRYVNSFAVKRQSFRKLLLRSRELEEIFGGPLKIQKLDGTLTETLLNVKVPVTGANSSGMAFVQAMRPDASKAWKYTYAAAQKAGGSKRIAFDPEN